MDDGIEMPDHTLGVKVRNAYDPVAEKAFAYWRRPVPN